MTTDLGNLYDNLPADAAGEIVTRLAEGGRFTLEKIVSTGQSTPAGEWYDQADDEWVILLAGGAGLLIEGEAAARTLNPGDFMLLPAHRRHRVEWTAADQPTVWLALHFAAEEGRETTA